jgi:hypothetical protein
MLQGKKDEALVYQRGAKLIPHPGQLNVASMASESAMYTHGTDRA